MTGGVVTIGETMALFDAAKIGPLQHAGSLMLGVGGSESNVAIALRRLGTDVTWVGKVGDDPLGDLIEREITAEGVGVVALRDPSAPTAIMVKEHRTSENIRVWYYRRQNAGSNLCKDEIDPGLIREASLLHVTGISLALSPVMAETIWDAVRIAREAGVRVSFDLNFRSKLWSREQAREAYRRMIPLADVVFGGEDEVAIAVGDAATPLELAHRLVELGAGDAVVKLGGDGAVGVVDGEEHTRAAIPIDVVDTVGAGDAFVAGYLAEYLVGEPVAQRLTTAVSAAAFVCLAHGDWQGSPRREELGLLNQTEAVTR